ncbi:EF-hand calcium-binding domain-containing protein 4A-like isoform X1 [Denticeps clupeoides]|uniref:EF-hand calcium-binding domain-containing protein 4A-like isoform X1 n=2 Tax=Denticeps clupeoides TaxID=299321 RepID=UPI0010A3CE8D|nr:EF-hand calcium-binding domain-containing protein 4A-like isoform X1 [Denticeps clupeoides]XP_028823317.1 EF-hand calcium-binding domain-containing protein 4A-like isoform X1 [Denticeps clupeoides]XP_028823318.1 EF-hand calcium-binding domain-containing protein 4A-like isoform X1 [Denticeps clupeoides]XP_028823319.1 EF-hand calcium-binding domain-containing protein 4A-like isoform X1 [Denticeps clupeoides]XP_028823320.1 EF-hand calcium-binding domain-containing protein 4A-like isoform X1 [De
MSAWLGDGEVLEAEGSGETSPCSLRLRGSGSPMPPRLRGGGASPRTGHRDGMGRAKELFELCDKEGKGFITKRDMQRLQEELPLSPEQLESVFESLDKDRNGFLTPMEFHTGLGGQEGEQPPVMVGAVKVEGGEIQFSQILVELGAEKIFKDQWELCDLWVQLQTERPQMLNALEELLTHVLTHLQDSLRERESLEQALRRREYDHDRVVRSIYEDMEHQIKEEREKRATQQCDRREQLQEQLMACEQELEFTLTKQRELENRVAVLTGEQSETRDQNHRLHSVNLQLQEQLDSSRDELQTALSLLEQLQTSLKQQQSRKDRDVLKVSKNMQREKESLLRQLDLLRDMNKRLRDEKDAHQTQKRRCNVRRLLEKKGSVIGDYLLHSNTVSRQPSSTEGLNTSTEPERTAGCQDTQTKETRQPADGQQDSSQRAFKVMFLGNSGVGKSSFIHHYCRGHFPNSMSSTVAIDFQMRSVTLDSTPIILQLWDTAGQERFHSITQQYYRKADGILAMYDLTQAGSLTALSHWLDQVQERVGEGAVLMLVGNKADLVDRGRSAVTMQDGRRMAERYQAQYFECSAKSGFNIEESMSHMARLLAAQQDWHRENTVVLDGHPTARGRCCK